MALPAHVQGLCRQQSCSRSASFGWADGERQFCSSHKRPGQIYLKSASDDVGRAGASQSHVPSGLDYNPVTERDAPTVQHSAAVGTRELCTHLGCTKGPSFGFSQEGKRLFCSSHKSPGTVFIKGDANVASIRATADHVPRGLDYTPATAMDPGQVKHSDHPHCRAAGCTKAPSYGFQGAPGMYCYAHKKVGMMLSKKAQATDHVPAGLDHHPNLGRAIPPTKPAARPLPPSAQPGNPDAPPLSEAATPVAEGLAAGEQAKAPSANLQLSARPDLETARLAMQAVKQNAEDPTVGIKYLHNVLLHPEEDKYRQLNLSNRKFFSEVWLNPGMRALFKAVGFIEGPGGLVHLGNLNDRAYQDISLVVQELMDITGRHAVVLVQPANAKPFPNMQHITEAPSA